MSTVHEPGRLAALRGSGLLDTPAEEAFDRLTRLSARILGAPLALVALVDEERDFYKSHCGLGEPLATRREARGTSLCQRVVERGEVLVIADTRADPALGAVDAVRALGVAAYVGVPLRTAGGHTLGAFCAMDFQPRAWTEADIEVLTELARSAEREIQLRQVVRAVGEQAAELDRRVAERTAELSAAVRSLEREVAGREAAQERLRASEAQFHELSENVRDVFWILDAHTGEPIYISAAYEEVWGRPVGDAFRRQELFLETIHPDDRERMEAAVTRRRERKRIEEYRIVRPDGAVRWIRDRAFPVRQADGSLTRLAGIAEDITEHHAAREQFRVLIENSSDITVVMDAEARLRYGSPSIERILGYRPDEVVGEPALGFVHPGDLEAASAALGEVLSEAGQIRRVEIRLRHRDGGYRTVELTGKNLLPHPGVAGIVVNAHDVTERRVSEERFRAVVESLAGALVILDPDGRVGYANRRFAEVTGHPAAEVVGRDLFALLAHPDEEEGTPRGASHERRILTRAGDTIWVQVSASEYRGAAGRVEGTVVGLVDVTERREAEAALRQRERDYRGLFENAHDALIIMAPGDERVLDVNPRACALYGYPRGRFIGSTMEAVSTDVELGRARLGRTLEEGVLRNFELAQRRADGSVIQVEVTAAVVEYRGRPAILSINRDVTERSRAAQAVRESEARFRAIFESAPAGIALLDEEGRVVDSNPALHEMLGRGADGLRGTLFSAIAEPGDAEVDARLLAAVVAGTSPATRVERRYRRADGEWFWTQVTLAAMRDDQGAPTCVLALVENVTERRAAEQALHEAEERLRQSHKMEAVGRLAGGIAHDFNNLLMAMMAHLYVLQRDPELPHGRQHNVGEIHRAAERAAALTRQLLDFSCRQTVAPRPLELNRVVTEMHRLLERLIGDDVELVLELDPELPPVEADPGQMEQVVMNLVVNARDALAGGGTIRVATRRVTLAGEVPHRPYVQPGAYAVLSVRDSGTGIDPADLERIWEPFYTTKGVGKGTGLGLAIVYGIVKGTSGYVWVESEPGAGATFEVYLPLAEARRPLPAPAPAAAPEARPGRETILLVEDDDALRAPVGAALREHGYTVLEAADGAAALAVAESHGAEIDLLVTDVVMPAMGGPNLGRRLASLRPGLRVLYMSGYVSEPQALRQAGLRPGSAFVEKPVRPDVLARRVRELLDGNGGGGG